MPKFLANNEASIRLILEVYLKGIINVLTFFGLKASTAIAAVKAESIPPDEPIIAPGNPFFWT